MYECFNCGHQTVGWDNDFSYEDYGIEGEGIIHVLHCSNCGAYIEYYCDLENNDATEGRSQSFQKRAGEL